MAEAVQAALLAFSTHLFHFLCFLNMMETGREEFEEVSPHPHPHKRTLGGVKQGSGMHCPPPALRRRFYSALGQDVLHGGPEGLLSTGM